MVFWGGPLRETVLSLLYPRRCPVCDKIVEKGLICEACKDKMTVIRAPYCMRCGKEIEKSSEELCDDCKRRRHLFEQNRAVFRYTKEARQSVARFKFHNKREYVDYYALQAERSLGDYISRVRPSLVIAVPMYDKKKRTRGYNQAEVFAGALAKRFSLPFRKGLLVRIKRTVPLKELSGPERRKELQGAFGVMHSSCLVGARVLLVDDIYTTGTTLDACTAVLKKAGVSQVYAVTLAIGAGLIGGRRGQENGFEMTEKEN